MALKCFISFILKLLRCSERKEYNNIKGGAIMASDQSDRKDQLDSHIETIEESIKAAQNSKEQIKEDLDSGKQAIENLERAEYEMDVNLNLLKSLNKDNVYELDEDTWEKYGVQYNKDRNLCASICDYRDRLSDRDSTLSPTLSGGFVTDASSTSPAVYIIFNDTPVDSDDFQSTAAKHEVEKHPVKLSDFICAEISKIDKDKADIFMKLVREFYAADPDVQYARLIDIRSLLFDQIFEDLCKEADYSRTAWFRHTPGGTVEKGKRFCQPKYFILGNTDCFALDPLMQNRIDTKCRYMYDLFGNLSTYGKHGVDARQTQYYFSETIATFSKIIELRKTHHS